jgi:hypothetical protein
MEYDSESPAKREWEQRLAKDLAIGFIFLGILMLATISCIAYWLL